MTTRVAPAAPAAPSAPSAPSISPIPPGSLFTPEALEEFNKLVDITFNYNIKEFNKMLNDIYKKRKSDNSASEDETDIDKPKKKVCKVHNVRIAKISRHDDDIMEEEAESPKVIKFDIYVNKKNVN